MFLANSPFSSLWTIVLAGGNGRRLASLTGGLPKQFWRSHGHPSLLEETLARIERLSPPTRTAIVVDQSHARFVAGTDYEWCGRLLYQPSDRGTAAGVLLGLMPALEADPDATVLITPSDHGILNPRLFWRSVRHAAARVARRPSDVVVFGVPPESQSSDFGWILAGPLAEGARDRRFRRLEGFVEKPSPEVATTLFEGRGLWSTMIVVARARTLFEGYGRHIPETAAVFAEYLRQPATERPEYLELAYPRLERADFSRDLLGAAENLVVCAWPRSIGWSDLGTPDRLDAWTRRKDEAATAPESTGIGLPLGAQFAVHRAR